MTWKMEVMEAAETKIKLGMTNGQLVWRSEIRGRLMLIECSCVAERELFTVVYYANHFHLSDIYYAPGTVLKNTILYVKCNNPNIYKVER